MRHFSITFCPPVPAFPVTPPFMGKTTAEKLTKSGVPAAAFAGSRARNIDGQPREDLGNLRTSHLVTTAVAAELLGLSVRGLEGMRMRRNGPPFVQISRRCIRYRVGDLERFITTKLVRTEADIDIATC
jgi:hypothetical protein